MRHRPCPYAGFGVDEVQHRLCRQGLGAGEFVGLAGVGLAGMSHALPHLQSGRLVRLLPDWWSDVGSQVVYLPMNRLRPRKTRVLVDTLLDVARAQDWAGQLDARPAALRPGARPS